MKCNCYQVFKEKSHDMDQCIYDCKLHGHLLEDFILDLKSDRPPCPLFRSSNCRCHLSGIRVAQDHYE